MQKKEIFIISALTINSAKTVKIERGRKLLKAMTGQQIKNKRNPLPFEEGLFGHKTKCKKMLDAMTFSYFKAKRKHLNRKIVEFCWYLAYSRMQCVRKSQPVYAQNIAFQLSFKIQLLIFLLPTLLGQNKETSFFIMRIICSKFVAP